VVSLLDWHSISVTNECVEVSCIISSLACL